MGKIMMNIIENRAFTELDLAALKAEVVGIELKKKHDILYDGTVTQAKADILELKNTRSILEEMIDSSEITGISRNQIEEILGLIESKNDMLTEFVNKYEKQFKITRKYGVAHLYERLCYDAEDYADKLYYKIAEQVWKANFSAKQEYGNFDFVFTKVLNVVSSDVKAIKEMNSQNYDQLMEVYVETLSMEEVNKKAEELEDSCR